MADAFTAQDETLEFGGRRGVSSLHLIESAISRPYSGYHRKFHEKCAALPQSAVCNHGFVDGNKRTAWILVELLISRSGYFLDIPDVEPVDDLVVSVASGQTEFEDLQIWFKER